jgi:hypothetical protein
MARGLDVDTVRTVVSYSAPMRMQTYVHRVGRTARAGRTGTAYTLLTGREVRRHPDRSAPPPLLWLTVCAGRLGPQMRHFKQMMREGRGAVIPRYKLPNDALAPYAAAYEVRARHGRSACRHLC